MPFTFQVLSVTAAVLFSYVMLVKLGVPWFAAALLAPLAGYAVWRWENADCENEPRWVGTLSSLKDLKDISKYLNQIF